MLHWCPCRGGWTLNALACPSAILDSSTAQRAMLKDGGSCLTSHRLPWAEYQSLTHVEYIDIDRSHFVRARLVPNPAVQLLGMYSGQSTHGSMGRKDTQGGPFIPYPRAIPLLQSRFNIRIKSRVWAERAPFRHPRGRAAPLSLSAAHLE